MDPETRPDDSPLAGDRPSPQEAGVRFGRYEVIRPIGRGGMATVYEAFDPDLGRRVALKIVLESESGSRGGVRLRREASAAAKLKHPNIVSVHDVGTVGDEGGVPAHYIAMDLIAGTTLSEAQRAMGTRERIEVLVVVARAVAHAHEHGVIHRDLKPQNVLVERAGDRDGSGMRWRVFLTDFGLARLSDGEDLTRTGTAMGTPFYMAPEQVRGDRARIGPWTDVWSLGIMLYELLANRVPFSADTAVQVYQKILTQDAPPPSASRDLQTIVARALEKDPYRRYASASAFADDLTRWLNGEPIRARPISTIRRAGRAVRRHKVVATAGAVVLVSLLVGIVAHLRQEREWEDRLALDREAQKRRTAALQRLATQWATIIERKRELRGLKVPVERARAELSAAVHAVDRHIEEWPDDPQGYYVRARGRMYQGDLAGAERDLAAALEKRPDFRPGWSLLGAVKLESYQRQIHVPPILYAQRVKELKPVLDEAEEAFRKGWESGREQEEAERWGLAWTREDHVTERLARAFRLRYYLERPREAVELLEQALRDYQAEEYACYLGFWREGDEAIPWLTRAIEWAPGYDVAHSYRGGAHMQMANYREAIANFTRALELNTAMTSAYYHRAFAYQRDQHWELSVRDFDRVIELEGERAEKGMIWLYWLRGNAKQAGGDLPGAIADYDRYLARQKAWEVYFNRGEAKQQSRDFEGALADFDEAVKLNAKDPDLHIKRALSRHVLKDFDGAIADYETSLRLAPRDWAHRRNAEHLLERARRDRERE